MILAFTAQSRGQGASTEQSQVTMGSAMMVGMQAGAQNGFLEGGELRGPRRVLWVSPVAMETHSCWMNPLS